MLMSLGMPALAAVGINKSRMKEIGTHGNVTDEEKELFLWAWDLLETVMVAEAEKGTDREIENMRTAMEIAEEELDEETGSFVIRTIRQIMEEVSRGEKRKRKR